MLARNIAHLSVEQLWNLGDGPLTIIFDDGVLETTARETIFSAYLWKYHRVYPGFPILKSHHIAGRRLGGRTHLDVMAEIMWDCHDTYNSAGTPVNVEHLTKLAYEITNEIYNDFTYRLEEYVTSISILDFIEVVEHPAIKEANANVEESQQSIDDTYAVIRSTLLAKDELVTNPIAKSAKSGLSSMGQIQQCVGPLGYRTEINSTVFRQPVLRGFVAGLTDLYSAMVESRSASKALMFAKDPLADSQYFNRKMQLLCGVLKNLHMGDCGTVVTIPWRVRAADLKTIDGKNYVVGNEIRRVSRKDKSLIGTVINMRSVFGCAHTDPYGVCSTCFGDLSLSIPANTILGHVSSTVLCEKVSQIVLSTKHLDGSATVDKFYISEYDRQFIENGRDPNVLKLARTLKGRKVKLYVLADEAKNLTDVTNVPDVRSLSIGRTSNLRDVQFGVEGPTGEVTGVVSVSMDSRLSSMTHELLAHIKKTDWTLTPQGDYIIDLTEWDFDKPLFELPLKHINMLDFMNSIEAMVKSASKVKGKKSLTLCDYDTPHKALVDFHDLVMSKLEINLAHLENIVYSTMITSSERYDYSLPQLGTPVEFGAYGTNMLMRSLGTTMAFQNQAAAILDVKSYVSDNRPDGPLDAMLMG